MLEDYLRDEQARGKDRGQRSILRIMRDIGLTENEIIEASFGTKRIKRLVVDDKETGLATDLLFQYTQSA